MKRRAAISTVAGLAFVQTTSAAGGKTLLVLGDSLTEGYGVLESEAYPALLRDRLGSGWNVVNGGLSGDTSAGGLRRLTWLLQSEPDVLVVALGGNDGLRGIDPGSTQKNLEKIIDRARSANPEIKILLAGISAPQNLGTEFLTRFEKTFPDVAKSKDVPLLPNLLKDVEGVPDLNLPDRIHPNPEGHKKVAQNVWGTLEKLVGS